MLPTFATARDEIFGIFHTKWAADTPALNNNAEILVLWQGVDNQSPPEATQPYARITVQHVSGAQSTFGETSNRRFRRAGLVTVQVFSPISKGGGLAFAENTAIIARDAFEGVGTASGIWFRNTNIQEIGLTKAWYQFNILAEFEYDEVK